MSLEERITNILNEKNAEIAKIVASEIEIFKASLIKEVPKEAEIKKTKKSVTIETPKVEEPKKEEPKKSKKVEEPKKEEPKAESKKSKKVEEPKIETKVETKKTKKEIERSDPKESPKKETTKKVDLSSQKCQHTIKSKPTPRLCDKACTNGGEINGTYYCATHFKAASEKVSSKPEVKPVATPLTTTPAPKCQKIENLKLAKAKDGTLYFKLDNGDKIIFRLDNKTPVGIGMIVAGTTAIVNMNSTIKHTLEMSNISFDKTKVATSSDASSETPVEEAESESAEAEQSEEDKEIQINDGDEDEDDEDGENDVEDEDEDEIEEEEASEEDEEDDE